MTQPPLTIAVSSADASAKLAENLAARLQPGDSILFFGPIGAGKTHVCRHLIQSLLNIPEDVPSPTFTLVQTYDTRSGEIWHADLYRLSDPDEVQELGLSDAFQSAICLIEWPDRLGDDAPADALHVTIEPDPDHEDKRHITFDWTDPKWPDRLEGLQHD